MSERLQAIELEMDKANQADVASVGLENEHAHLLKKMEVIKISFMLRAFERRFLLHLRLKMTRGCR